MEKIKIEIYVNQLGNLKIYWKIPVNLFIDFEEVYFQIPSFKFDMPKVFGLPVPFSSRAIKVNICNITVKYNKQNISYVFYENFEGNNILKLNPEEIGNIKKEKGSISIYYEIENIVNSDTIYYVFVYPLLNPFSKNVIFNIYVKARFSYKIRKYKFREWYFNKTTGLRIEQPKVFNSKKRGDLIIVDSQNLVLDKEMELDIHLTGSRFPFMIRRDIFWLIIFIISLGIILSPLLSTFICN